MTRVVLLAIALAVAAGLSADANRSGVTTVSYTPVAAASCGLKPLKPIRPPGCKDLVAECLCDSSGQNCSWEWICVK